eukprot:c2046_g1_i1.p3 GENE.c2046_g1_i1~~c2046_g1_i1.p3  ORF type:complete len:264 (+),score=71.10 c2046_g1_i1:375-1166(+)
MAVAQGHPCICKLWGFLECSEPQYPIVLVMDRVRGRSLDLVIHSTRWDRLAEQTVAQLGAILIDGLRHLNNLNIVLRDMTSRNILIRTNEDGTRGTPTLIDFGMARQLPHNGHCLFEYCGTRHSRSPEMITGHGYGIPADWWALGVVLYEALFGVLPFYDADDDALDYKITHATSLKFPENVPASTTAKDAIAQLLHTDPLTRMNATNAMEHPFFKEYLQLAESHFEIALSDDAASDTDCAHDTRVFDDFDKDETHTQTREKN